MVGADLTEAVRLLSHDLTVSSYSVLADTLNAGLKLNLVASSNKREWTNGKLS